MGTRWVLYEKPPGGKQVELPLVESSLKKKGKIAPGVPQIERRVLMGKRRIQRTPKPYRVGSVVS